ncbi:hypothetical protein [uncultured Nocardioides sp.]|uniref:hypothetical protein n=1 Tax=uncultured Nocardioides sp. TaxID=198441 RepID=UPI0026176529|nr:hypothetical protein [uncultured Nocardioides sp.]
MSNLRFHWFLDSNGGRVVTFDGACVSAADATLAWRQEPVPGMYVESGSPGAIPVYLIWGEPVEAVRDRIAWVRRLSAGPGRAAPPRFGVRLDTIARDSRAEAQAVEARLTGAGPTLVGSHADIADLVEQYVDAGVEEFVLSGPSRVEEAYWFGEGVVPELTRRGLWPTPLSVGPAA